MPSSIFRASISVLCLTAVAGPAFAATPGMLAGMMDNFGMGPGMMGPGTENPNPQRGQETAEGAQLTQEYCTQCHALPSPQQHTAQQWPYVVNRMKHYMAAQGAAIPDKEATEKILEYLESNSTR